jgi:hypothetical protein
MTVSTISRCSSILWKIFGSKTNREAGTGFYLFKGKVYASPKKASV